MSLQQQEDCSCDVPDDVVDVANMADVADEDDVQTCQPILTDIRQLVSRFPHKHEHRGTIRPPDDLWLECLCFTTVLSFLPDL